MHGYYSQEFSSPLKTSASCSIAFHSLFRDSLHTSETKSTPWNVQSLQILGPASRASVYPNSSRIYHLPYIREVEWIPKGPVTLDVTPITAGQLAALAPFTQFARAAYCPSDRIAEWTCGEACNAIPGFEPTWASGDGSGVQLYPTHLLSMLTDIRVFRRPLDQKLFPGVPSNIHVHGGFGHEHAKTAVTTLKKVEAIISSKNATSVVLVGHSLGGALAELGALYMSLNLPSHIRIKAVTFGTPRVGNQAFASYFDARVIDFSRVNNKKDFIPILPRLHLGFEHPRGEIHIVSPNNAFACSGNEAVEAECTKGTVPDIFWGNILDHLGPYQGIKIGTIYCK
ncbi:hypothetical protein NLI96_g519 [Meripilus lineatus]|uniref:Fungal lipase-type domain-containing protein n=1 Tax=Meripilus lineatus TaxID=2056292 RepID=A0AAD5YNX0_9APHY|nr:hypothetical protein NLI96_g519 [Physisporinus lineatus]